MIRRFGHVKVSTGRKLFNGMIRNNWKVCEYSERDIAKFEAPLGIKPLGVRAANRRFVETFENFKPDVLLIGHSDLLTNETFGIYGKPSVYGQKYDYILETSKMALNLNRYEDWPWYSSARIAQIMGNGLLAFVWDKGSFVLW